MIETVKHVFEIANVQFVFVTNTQQIETIVESRYGNSIDSQQYLGKFFGFKLELPRDVYMPSTRQRAASLEYYNLLVQASPELSETALNQESGDGSYILKYFIEKEAHSLREIKQLVKNIEIYVLLSGGFNPSSVSLTTLSLYLFIFHLDICADIMNKKMLARDLAAIWKVKELPSKTVYEEMRYLFPVLLWLVPAAWELFDRAGIQSDFVPEEDVEFWKQQAMKFSKFSTDFTETIRDVLKRMSLCYDN